MGLHRNIVSMTKYYCCAGSCLTLCSPVDCSPPGSSIRGTFQARRIPCLPPGDLPNPGIEPLSPVLAGKFFTTEPPGMPQIIHTYHKKIL